MHRLTRVFRVAGFFRNNLWSRLNTYLVEMMPSIGGQVLCAKQVGQRLGVTPKTAAKLLREGSIRGFRIGREWRTTSAEVDGYIARELERAA